ncbi:MAG: PIG-L family deacetylase, partial [Polyangia bacterium]
MNLAQHRRVPTSSCINSSRGCRAVSGSSTLARFAGVALVIAAVAGCTDAAEQDPNLTVAPLATPVAVTVNSVSTRKPYAPASAVPGAAYYIDRGFKIGSLSAALNGGTLIKTANDDKNVTATNHLRFTPAAAATVYVGMDRRTTRLPAWLDSTWRLTTESFVSNGDGAASPMKMYAKDFASGVIQLGGNKQSPAAGMASNYVVVVVARATSTGTGGSGTGGAATGTGGAGTGGAATGGRGTGGAGTGGTATGGTNTGGAATGGANTGGAATGTGGAGTGGAATGGRGTGGAGTGGAATGGANTGGANTGGANTGGANTGGANTGGANTGGANTGGAATGGAGTGGAAGSGVASLYVVAHPDDELLFMNPDLEGAIQAGGIVVTAYATSGDGGNPNGPWAARE